MVCVLALGLAAVVVRGLGAALSPGPWRALALRGLGATLWVTVLTVLISMPVGLLAAAWRTRFARTRRRVIALGLAVEALSALPPVLYGVAGYLLLVRALGLRPSLLLGAGVLSCMSLPVATARAESALRAVPRELEEASLAMGATWAQTFVRVTLPLAARGLGAGALAVAARALGLGAPLVFTAGLFAGSGPLDPRGPEAVLTVQLLRAVTLPAPEAQPLAALCAALLVGLATVAALLGRQGRPK